MMIAHRFVWIEDVCHPPASRSAGSGDAASLPCSTSYQQSRNALTVLRASSCMQRQTSAAEIVADHITGQFCGSHRALPYNVDCEPVAGTAKLQTLVIKDKGSEDICLAGDAFCCTPYVA